MLNQKPTETNNYNTVLDFETILNLSFANYKKIALYAGLTLFVSFFLFLFFSSVVMANFIDVEKINEKSIENFQKILLSKPYIWYYTGFSIFISCIICPFMAGFYKMAEAAENDTSFGLSNLFSLYFSPQFLALFSVTLLINLVTNGLSLLFDEIGLQFFGLIATILISFATLFTIPLIVFENCNTIDSIKKSFSIVSQQPIVILMLIIIALVGALLGLFAFCIGVFFTYPFLISVIYTTYKEVTDTKKQNNMQ